MRFRPTALALALTVVAGLAGQQAVHSADSHRPKPHAPQLLGDVVPVGTGTPVKLMPLGDSNTEGVDVVYEGYRGDLWHLLTSDGRPVDFVGSLSAGAANLPDRNHEGHGGWTIQGIYDNVIGFMNAAHPDVITLQIGTNDMNTEELVAAAPGRLAALIDRIGQTDPKVKLFVTTIPPIVSELGQRRAQGYNATIAPIVEQRRRAGQKVAFVDTGSGYVQPHDFGDPVHVLYGAASKGALRWYDALTGQTSTRYEAEQNSTATVVHAQRDTNYSASGGTKVGNIDYADSSVTFKVNAAAAGKYRVHLRGANGTGTTCTHNFSVNGGTASTVSYPSYGTTLEHWRMWSMQKVDIRLPAGPSSLKITKGTCSAELDSLDLTGPKN
ncbi:GDSL-type esterase/lipase family protein [Kribbella sp. NPDC051952]|uniref:GDSL-type esterase/lipase family protein n=1 Tax=Kribbella sp. NPDC051952 TaxID=3154851 RepID=UPI00341D32F1